MRSFVLALATRIATPFLLLLLAAEVKKIKMQEYFGGPGNINNEKIQNCKICAVAGFPHEPIIFVKSGVVEDVFPFESIVGKKIIKTKWQIYDYFTGKRHEHKSRIRDEVAA
jgi:hypothetical protein